MAKKSQSASSGTTFKVKSKTKRPGVHSKKKSSSLKSSKNYRKPYKGQGK